MPNPTRREIINAHDAVEGLTNAALPTADFCGDTSKFLMWQKDILAALPPRPRPTMAEVEWDDDLHYLAEAESDIFGTVIMLSQNEDGHIEFFAPKEKSSRTDESLTRTLTPTGRRYTLTEIENA